MPRFATLERDEIGGVNYLIEQVRLDVRALDLRGARSTRRRSAGRARGASSRSWPRSRREYAELEAKRREKTAEALAIAS